MSQNHRKRPDSPFGEALKELLRRKGLTQAALAEESTVPVETLSRMIKGERLNGTNARIHLRNIVRACYDLGVIRTVEEANYLITRIPSTKELDRRDRDDLLLILRLEEPATQESSLASMNQQGELRGENGKDMLTREDAAWSLYIELMTRIATQPLDSRQGLLREVLNSLYALFTGTRTILHHAGAQLATAGEQPVGLIGISMLNNGLRPFMTKWHPLLQQYEKGRQENQSAYEHERAWEKAEEMRQELARLQEHLEEYAEALAGIVGIPHVKFPRAD
jgi:transcriptional regulator with XRE-family HTH domain